MTMAQCQQLYNLQEKARLIKGKNTPKSSRAVEASVAVLEVKTDISSNKSLCTEEKPKHITEKIKPLTEREVEGAVSWMS